MGGPGGVGGEETVDEADLVGEEEAEGETEDAGAGDEGLVKSAEAGSGIGKGQRESAGDEHHSGDRAQSKNQQIKDGPARVVNGGKHEQSDGGGACESMDDADEQWAKCVEPAEVEERFFDEAGGRQGISVMLLSRGMSVPVVMKMMVVLVNVSVLAADMRMRGGEFFADPLGGAGEVENAEKNEHEADGKFHGEAETRGNDEIKEDDSGADDDNGDGVAESPEGADEGGFGEGALAADDGRDGDYVVGIGGMAHTEKEADSENGETAEHALAASFGG